MTIARRTQARAYLPLRLADRLSGTGEGECRFDGTVLVADIAGYARLTAAFAAQGEEGIERLWQTLGGAFRAGLDAAESFGGEVVYFAGDALICYWQADDEHPGRDAELAAACAHQMLRSGAAPPFASPQGPAPLHVGIASGPLWAAKVGGWSGRWNLLFGGQATRGAFAATRQAARGELRMDPSTRQRLDDTAAVRSAAPVTLNEPIAQPSPMLAIPTHHHLLPPGMEQRAELDDGVWSAELRPIDCLFLRLPTLDEDAPGALEKFRKALFLAQDTLGMASGTGRLVIDDRGLTLVWVAGEPMAGQSRTPEASLSLAADVFEVLRAAGLQPAAGFAWGRAFCATLGNDSRREPVVIGTPMILAARLMDLALGDLTLPAGLEGTAPAGLTIDRSEQRVVLKGFAEAVEICRIRPQPGRSGSRALALAGRDEELAVVEQRLDAAAHRRGGVVAIAAAAGMGKSALMRAVRAACQRRGLRFGLGEAFGAERRVPYFAWRAIVRGLFGDLRFDDPAALRGQLAGALARTGRDPGLAPLLEVVFPAGAAETPQTRPIVGENRARATRDLILALFQPLAAEPLVIVIEDLHHMDTPSLQLLELATRRLPHALFVLTTRPQPPTEAAELLGRADTHLELRPLAAGGVAALARDRLGLQITPALAAEVCRRANGIPLYAFEYLRQAREALPPSQRQAPLAELPPAMRASMAAATGDPLRGVLMRSFEGLSPVENRAVKAASVLGDRFTPPLLQEIVSDDGEEPVDVAPALQRLADRGLMVTESGEHHFSHALVQTSCYETIPVHLRRTLHGRAAAALERALERQSAEAETDEQLVSLTHHHWSAGNPERTIHFGERAAWRARRHGAYREAMRLLDRCLEASARLPLPAGVSDPRIRWRRLKAEAAGAVGDRETREREAREAIALTGVKSTRGRILPAVAGVARLLGRTLARPERLLATGPARARRGAEGYRDLAQAHRQLAIGAYFSGDGAETAYNTTSALAHATRIGRSPELSDSLASLGTCLGLVGFPGAARRHLEAARVLAHDLGDGASIAYAEVTTALFSVGQGQWETVRAATERCAQASRRVGDTGTWGYAQALRFWMHHYRGEMGEADRCAEALREASRATGNLQHESWAARFLAQGCMRRREWAAARAHLENARSLFSEAEKNRELRPLYELIPILGDLAATLEELGRTAEARVQAEAALAEFARARRPSGHAILEGCSAVAGVYLGLLQSGESDSHTAARARLSVEILRRYCRVFPIGRPRLALWRGHWLFTRGRRAAALASWRAGLDAAVALEMKHDEQLLRAALAG